MKTQEITEQLMKITYKVEQNPLYGDFRVVKYIDNQWTNERDGNWTKEKAQTIAENYKNLTKNGISTMGDKL